MDKEERERKRAYFRNYYKNNKEKYKKANMNYWKKKIDKDKEVEDV